MTDLLAIAPEDTVDADTTVRGALDNAYTADRWLADLRKLAKGARTGFDVLEDVGMRWQPGKVYAVIARPGHGKTAFMLEAALRYLEGDPERLAAFISWEEPIADLFTRIVLRDDARQYHVSGAFAEPPIFRGTVREWGRDPSSAGAYRLRIEEAAERIGPLVARLRLIDGDAVDRNADTVLRHIAAWARERDRRLGLLCCDYFQKLRIEEGGYSKQNELAEVANVVRRFARGSNLVVGRETIDEAFAVPLLIGAQVTRGGDDDAKNHPSGDRVREADDLLNDAGAVIALSYETRPSSASDQLRSLRISVPKHRDGRARPTEVAQLSWRPARVWFGEAADQDLAGAVAWTAVKEICPAGEAGGAGVLDEASGGPRRNGRGNGKHAADAILSSDAANTSSMSDVIRRI